MKRTALLLLAACACGQPLAGPDYRGTAFATLKANVTWAGEDDPPDGGIMAALFFAPDLTSVDPATWTEATGTTTPIPSVPADLTMNVFALPAPALFVRDGGFGVARLLAYRDLDGDGRYDPGEPFLGIEPPFVWVYAPAPLAASASPTGTALPQGFNHLVLPQRCAPPPGPTTPGNCGVPLGAQCSVDADCGPGLCLKETKFPWPAGYCVLPEPVADGGCRPGDGVFAGAPKYSPTPPGVTGFWLRRCATDADCARPDSRDQGLYACDIGLGGCIPTVRGAPLPLGDRLEVEPFCSGPRGP